MKKFSIIKQIGTGGMANVHLAILESEFGMQRLCAIKQIRKEVLDSNTHDMFIQEMKTCLKLNHANIVSVVDVTELDGSPAIVMEFVNGTSLEHLQRSFAGLGARVPLNLILYVGSEIAKGLHYIHSASDDLTGEPLGIIHRDLSPSNILLGANGEVKIADFGVAKSKINSTETQAGIVKGKYRFMSPEHIQGKKIDCRADIYSLGIVLWELITGTKLYQAEEIAELVTQVASGSPYQSILEVSPGIAKELAQIIDRMLAIMPSDRYQSANEITHDLTRFLFQQKEPFSSQNLQNIVTQIASQKISEINHLVKSQSSAKPATPSFSQEDAPKANQVEDQRRPIGFINDDDTYEPTSVQFSSESLVAQPRQQKRAVGAEHFSQDDNANHQAHAQKRDANSIAQVVKTENGENIHINVVLPQQNESSQSHGQWQKGRDLTYVGGGTQINQSMNNLPSSREASSASHTFKPVSIRQTMPPQRIVQKKNNGLILFTIVATLISVAIVLRMLGYIPLP